MEPKGPRVRAGALRRFIARLVEGFAVPPDDADFAAEVLVTADLYGVDSHGSARRFYYVQKLESGLIGQRWGALVKPVCAAAGGRVPVVAGVSDMDTADAVARPKAAAAGGTKSPRAWEDIHDLA